MCVPNGGGGGGVISGVIWRSALLCCALLAGEEEVALKEASLLVEGKDVLEVGCGRALSGLLCHAMGARRVVLSDCDDRVLKLLLTQQQSDDRDRLSVRHLLWEQDVCERVAGHACPPLRHWSVAHRDEGSIRSLEYGQQFDLVVGSDCIYFPSQEIPLAHVIAQRCRKPDGMALVVHQQRPAVQIERFVHALGDVGMKAQLFEGSTQEWAYDRLLKNHVQCFPEQADATLAQIINDAGAPLQVVIVRWQ